MLTWKYNRFGNVEIWNGEVNPYEVKGESDIYVHLDFDVEIFFENIGVNQDNVSSGDWGTSDDPGYFID